MQEKLKIIKNFAIKRQREILIAALILAAGSVGIFLDYRHLSAKEKTIYEKMGDQSYEKLKSGEEIKTLTITPGSKTLHVPVLMYHHIGDPPENASKTRLGLTVSAQNFAEQIKWLKDNGFSSVTLSQIYDYLSGKPVKWPQKPIAITIDDGYQDAFDNAIPVLKQYGFTAAFGIITQYPSQKQGDNFYASWPLIAKAKEEGMEIICHTQNHFYGKDPKYSADYIFENLSGCQEDIKSHLGETEPFLIYPYGAYTPMYIEQAKKAGFVMAFTIHYGQFIDSENLMQSPRVRINGDEDLKQFERVMKADLPLATSTKSSEIKK